MGERRGVYRVSWGKLKERDHLGDPGVNGRIDESSGSGICGDVYWIELAQERDRWRALATAVMNSRVQ